MSPSHPCIHQDSVLTEAFFKAYSSTILSLFLLNSILKGIELPRLVSTNLKSRKRARSYTFILGNSMTEKSPVCSHT